MRGFKDYMFCHEYSEKMEHKKWRKEIPYLQFPADYHVQVTPSFGGAVVRFCVKKQDAWVSIYLDCYDRLRFFGSPYWEVYPIDEDVERFSIEDTEGLMNCISRSIKQQLNEN